MLRFLDEKRETGILEFSGGDTIETISGSPPGRIFHLAEISKEKRKDVLSSGGKKERKEHRETIKGDDRGTIDRSIDRKRGVRPFNEGYIKRRERKEGRKEKGPQETNFRDISLTKLVIDVPFVRR